VVRRAGPEIKDLWRAVSRVLDPEVPALSVVDLGIVRDIRLEVDEVVVDVTPTYSGCPAMDVIEADIIAALRHAGAERVTVRTVYQPAWTTDWLSDDAKAALKAYGIAPPVASEGAEELIPLRRRPQAIACPFCGSLDTTMRSEFGSTACKAICFCNHCQQPFEYFRPL
jgi:ring-1,2-phenylacetyl-CoA epoxidase subunit PaaD